MKTHISKLIAILILFINCSCSRVNDNQKHDSQNLKPVSLSFQNSLPNQNMFDFEFKGVRDQSCNPYSSEDKWKLGTGDYAKENNLIIKDYNTCSLYIKEVLVKNKSNNTEHTKKFEVSKMISKAFQKSDSFILKFNADEEFSVNISFTKVGDNNPPKLEVIFQQINKTNISSKAITIDNKFKITGMSRKYIYSGNLKFTAQQSALIKEYFIYEKSAEDEDLDEQELNNKYRNTNVQINKKSFPMPKSTLHLFPDYFIESHITHHDYPQTDAPEEFIRKHFAKYNLILVTNTGGYIVYDLL